MKIEFLAKYSISNFCHVVNSDTVEITQKKEYFILEEFLKNT
jgi:hypothetical protein